MAAKKSRSRKEAKTGIESAGASEPPPPLAPGHSLPGFAWVVPAAFSGPVSVCRFEQGDVLYAAAAGYGDWSGAPVTPWLQVLDPPRSARARTGDGDANRFVANWGSPVEIELARGDGSGEATTAKLKTTQGRLFTCLWRGDLSVLEAAEAPTPPILQSDLQRNLDQALEVLRAALAGTRAGANGLLYVSSVDRSADASIAKAASTEAVLAARFELRVHEASPESCRVTDGERYHPALQVRGVAIASGDEAAVTDVLKPALYNPGNGLREGKADRFSLARHGLLVPLQGSPSG